MRIHAAVSAAALLVWAAAGFVAAPAQAATAECAQATVSNPAQATASNPAGPTITTIGSTQTPASVPGGCWTDVLPYPFGADGNPVTVLTATTTTMTTLSAGSALPLNSIPVTEQNTTGSVIVADSAGTESLNFNGSGVTPSQCGGPPPCLTDVTGGTAGATVVAGTIVTFLLHGGGGVPATSTPYQTVTSMAFRAWNRGLAATTAPGQGSAQQNAFGVWEYNGSRWTSVPYPGSSTCPGNTILWAGKLDYWLIGAGSNVLCRFDGENDVWDTMTAPAAAFPSGLNPLNPTDINAGSCFAWNNCWFFGTFGAVVHWDGASLTAESVGLSNTPWLQGDYEAATAATGPSGGPIGVAVGGPVAGRSTTPNPTNQPEPDPQLLTSGGGAFAPATLDPSEFGDGPTNLVSVSFDGNGDGWVAGNPLNGSSAPFAPIFPISADGTAEACPTTQDFPGPVPGSQLSSYEWAGLGSVAGGSGSIAAVSDGSPDGSAIVGGQETPPGQAMEPQPALVQASCSTATVTTFQIPAPGAFAGDPVDFGGAIGAVAASATNDAWAASTNGIDGEPGNQLYQGPPHLYQWANGQPPDAPAGNDVESRPIITTPSPTVFEFPPPVVVAPVVTPATTVKTAKPKKKKKTLPAATYDISKPKLHRLREKGSYRLTVTFKVRRKVTIGLDALHSGRVVARSGMKTFRGRTGALSVVVNRKRWPTGLKFVQPGKKS